jgi:hypothetical protein
MFRKFNCTSSVNHRLITGIAAAIDYLDSGKVKVEGKFLIFHCLRSVLCC